MKSIWLIAATLATLVFTGSVVADQVTITGQIVSPTTDTSSNIATSTQSDGTTSYVVYSSVSGDRLASFSTLAAAQTFMAQLSPTALNR